MDSNVSAISKAMKRTYDEFSAGSSTSSSTSNFKIKSSEKDPYKQLKEDAPLMIAEIKRLRSEKSVLFEESVASKLEIERLKKELQQEIKASTSLKKDLEESKLTIAELVEKTNNLQASVDLTVLQLLSRLHH